jgi:hypothetical protein
LLDIVTHPRSVLHMMAVGIDYGMTQMGADGG